MQGVYSALYAVTHAVQLVAYLAAGWVGAGAGLTPAFLGLAGVALVLVLTAARVWRPADGDKKGVAAAAAASLEPVPASKRRNGA
jgi:hypothetical protein